MMRLRSRTGVFTLSFFLVGDAPKFTWGCVAGDDLHKYFAEARPPYPDETVKFATGLWDVFVGSNT